MSAQEPQNIAVIGAGWYGCEVAKALAKQKNAQITLLEKNPDIFSGTSGKLGVRDHLGPHYPRSKETRKSCLRGHDKFFSTYEKLLSRHGHSLYGIGDKDLDSKPSKVSAKNFEALEDEHSSFKVRHPSHYKEYQHLETILETDEMNILVGDELRQFMNDQLRKENIEIKLHTEVEKIVTDERSKIFITTKNTKTKETETKEFDAVVNATSYQEFLPDKPLLFDMKVVYQSCLGLLYEDTKEAELGPANPIIIMDGWFPCLVYYDNKGKEGRSRYLMTHAKYTNLNSCATPEEARTLLSQELANQEFLPNVEKSAREHMTNFYPGFRERFTYQGYVETVHAKIASDTDFREAVVFQHEQSKMIYIIPGKIANIFDAAEDVLNLLYPQLNQSKIISKKGYLYVEGGTLCRGEEEISKKPTDPSRSTYELQTGEKIWKAIGGDPSVFAQKRAELSSVSCNSCPSRLKTLLEKKDAVSPQNTVVVSRLYSNSNSIRQTFLQPVRGKLSDPLSELKQLPPSVKNSSVLAIPVGAMRK